MQNVMQQWLQAEKFEEKKEKVKLKEEGKDHEVEIHRVKYDSLGCYLLTF